MFKEFSYSPTKIPVLKEKALAWAEQFEQLCFLENNARVDYPYGPFQNLLAVGAQKEVQIEPGHTFSSVERFHQAHKDWVFGFFSYDLKNELEDLNSLNPAQTAFPEAYFFVPKHLVFFKPDSLAILTEGNLDPLVVLEAIEATETPLQPLNTQLMPIKQQVGKEDYLTKIEKIKHHIEEGEVYELNYCIAFSIEAISLQPVPTFIELNRLSPMPFAAFIKYHDQFLLSASPERFLKKEGNKLISQPIKGTTKRGKTDEQDELLKLALQQSEKERAENMMIVDLVRNDLARNALPGTVEVPEMFGIYSFPQVHQMISTVTAQLKPGGSGLMALKDAFPMGSMTGAPKIEAMKLIDELEDSRRGLFSGTVGYISPEGDFDFNVVIRSLFYNRQSKKLSWQVGSAITYDAEGEQEYAECLLKAEAIKKVIDGSLFDTGNKKG